ncbi:erythrocyte membrane protein 1, PfEMP1, putative [Plasmodium reichenowi]|uniref:Erythrocyte membrane protein 1, PfEMP1, putative n=1 Tax=Plasmodium reichenowi TaxID=5854 RepID=A0A2P9D5M9_PLARE|nr:erythrocyte membrane protein 1, PfEMP1, putative [Plasmodium reichenowi]
MAPPQRASAKEIDYSEINDAKDLLDKIGEKVYDKLHNDALGRSKNKLHGRLSKARFSDNSKVTSNNPCNLNYNYDTNVSWGVINPCKHKSLERFSEVSGGECDNSKIKDSKNDKVGACAPFRRLHVCDRNLEQIQPNEINKTEAKHNLLVDVCIAAKFEGQSIKGYYPQYQNKYKDSQSQMCTMLARSFADIGDIIRGRDLFHGYNETDKAQKRKLENNLRKIFSEIHNSLDNSIKSNYNDDKSGNYFKLREDWWNANRLDVWKALTCDAPAGAQYFRATCNRADPKTQSVTPTHCRCTIQDVPTFFDYVPQYLRWFEEWAEDFCRKRKYKLEMLEKQCRLKEENEEKYCDRNGYDCTKTIRGKGILVPNSDCNDCSFSCTRFVNWIDNQKEEFEKQRNKYADEIKKWDGTTVQTADGKINNIYEKEFYTELTKNYKDVEKFLQKLNNETICKKTNKEKKEEASPVDFTNDKTEKTFDHKLYCDTCPWCAKKVRVHGEWTNEEYPDQCPIQTISAHDNKESTDITILTPDRGKSIILDKYSKLCNDHEKKETETWKCHYERRKVDEEGSGNDYCVLQDNNKDKPQHRTIKPYETLFEGWLSEMLEDSKKWRNQHSQCINNKETTKCQDGCKTTCKCFLKWVQEKKKEWKIMEESFDKQKNTDDLSLYEILQSYLDVLFENKIEEAYGDEEEVEELKRKLPKLQEYRGPDTVHSQFTVDVLLQHEEDIATKCLENNKEDKCPDRDPREFARSDSHGEQQPPKIPRITTKDAEESEEEEEDTTQDTEDTVTETSSQPKDDFDVCPIVKTALEDKKNLDAACSLKYGPNAPTSWKCIPTGSDVAATDSESGRRMAKRGAEKSDSSSSSGAICVPPRRRKLYVGGLTKWATSDEATKGSKSQDGALQTEAGGSSSESSGSANGTAEGSRGTASEAEGGSANGDQQSSSSTSSPSTNLRDGLLEAFIESAAVETFFLWDRYKKEWYHKNKPQNELVGAYPNGPRGGHGTRDSGAHGPFSNMGNGMSALPVAIAGVGQPHLQATQLRTPLLQLESSGQPQRPVLLNGVLDDQLGNLSGENLTPNDPSNLSSGNIPPDFLRQMFYTIADYRDILVRGGNNTSDSGSEKDGDGSSNHDRNIVLEASGNDQKAAMVKIQEELKKFFQNSGNPENSGNDQSLSGSPHSTGVQTPSTSDKLTQWWSNNAEHIWNGMICALTYKDNSEIEAKGDHAKTISQDGTLKTELYDKNTKPDGKYHYNKVEVKDEEEGGERKNDTIPPPTLKNFVLRPPFFRYLEEWGENFCKKRTEMLEKIKYECRSTTNSGHQYCSGDGYDCTGEANYRNENFADLNCHGCGEECMKYKKWIDQKFEEYHNQKNKYNEEHGKLTSGGNCSGKSSGDDKKFCEQIRQHTTVDLFLKALKNCSNDQSDGEQGDEEKNKIDFDNPPNMFNPSTYCKACPIYGVKCNGTGVCQNNPENKENTAQGEKTVIDILINDGSTDGIDEQLKNCFKKYSLFKGLSKHGWKCQKKNGVDQCNLTNTVNETYFDKDIVFNEFFQRWLRYFVHDYNKFKDKIHRCIKKEKEDGKVDQCIIGCKNKCKCVKTWLEIKGKEWETIKKYYKENLKISDQDIASRIRSYFVENIYFDKDYKKAQEVVEKPCEKQQLWGCTGKNLKEGDDGKNCDMGDFITNLIKKLQEKATTCAEEHKENSGKKCTPPDNTLDDEEEEQNQVEKGKVANKAPTFCNIEEKKPENDVHDDECKAADNSVPKDDSEKEEENDKGDGGENNDPSPAPSSGDEGNPEQTPVLKPEEEAPPQEQALAPKGPVIPERRPAVVKKKQRARERRNPQVEQPYLSKPLFDAMLYNTLAWCIGIGITGLIYWFIKKKPKRPVDLFSVLEIPQNDYGMPTLKSKNRYIPYKSAQYRGKRYIYIEGDSSGDEKYAFMSDTTDVTSSESEYEEFDINDIYVPGSPKYKTLIEVVLEPSKRDTTNTPNDISSGDTPTNKFTDNELNELKQNFISNMLQNEKNDIPNNNISATIPTNTNNTTPSHNKLDQKPFIMSIHDRNLLSGEEYSYDMSTNSDNNDLYSGIYPTSDNRGSYSDKNGPYSDKHYPYSGIDLINDALSGDNHDIYNELLKRKENELFGTNHRKHTTTNRFAKPTNSDPIINQLDLFHKWLDRHRDMCELWDKNKKEELLDKLKEEWNKDNNNSGNKNSNIPSNIPNSDIQTSDIHSRKLSDMHSGKLSDIPSGKLSGIPSDNNIDSDIHPSDIPSGKLSDILSDNNIHSDIPHVLNSDVSIQIHMDNNQVDDNIYLDTYPDKYIVDNINPVDENPTNPNPNHVQIQMSVKNTQMMEDKYPIGDVWDI